MNPMPRYRLERLSTSHDKLAFESTSDALNQYLQKQVSQDIRRNIANCFVMVNHEDRIVAYYTLASASLLLSDLPVSLGKKLPRYPTVPTVKLGRLAVDKKYTGQGLGGIMLADALDRVIRSDIAAYALVVDAKDQTAIDFYLHHGFLSLSNKIQTLFLPLNIHIKEKLMKF